MDIAKRTFRWTTGVKRTCASRSVEKIDRLDSGPRAEKAQRNPPFSEARHAALMADYRRNRLPGGTFIFEVDLLDRRSHLTVAVDDTRLRFRYTRHGVDFELYQAFCECAKYVANFTYIDDFDFLYVFSDLNAPTRAPIYTERSELSAWDSVARTTCVTAYATKPFGRAVVNEETRPYPDNSRCI